MNTIEIDASRCWNHKEFAVLLQETIRALPGHGSSVEAFVDSMVFGTMSELSPPYRIVVLGELRPEVRAFAADLSNAIGQARLERRTRRGEDVEVSLKVGA
ncbi:hypothetical protein ASE17_15250 [Phenylobacterium sp. Root77]|jgi:hypothetical protein|uniref:hypothetical protein n=1 Tax=unclassified Phenylobacterium TaxID=2640670 RepID=UPI0006F8E00C|nr:MULTISPECIES: hypothetical protein [unclassified Phenylobacterium]KQW70984.1 hypothetical protein ASC73_13130 [Phenylobacterium sp. Root1277]KQW95858.1 hypothetical protein ASC79_09310 [Phenylobacterium sp. Root1290]KRC41643.1 hypothetical protein ASE17_15250 [Phenylobacterium sp. Root77]